MDHLDRVVQLACFSAFAEALRDRVRVVSEDHQRGREVMGEHPKQVRLLAFPLSHLPAVGAVGTLDEIHQAEQQHLDDDRDQGPERIEAPGIHRGGEVDPEALGKKEIQGHRDV